MRDHQEYDPQPYRQKIVDSIPSGPGRRFNRLFNIRWFLVGHSFLDLFGKANVAMESALRRFTT